MNKILRAALAHAPGWLVLAILLGAGYALLSGAIHLAREADGQSETRALIPASPSEAPESCFVTSDETRELAIVRPDSGSNLSRSSSPGVRSRRFLEMLSRVFQQLHAAMPASSSDHRAEKWLAVSPVLLSLASPVRAGPFA